MVVNPTLCQETKDTVQNGSRPGSVDRFKNLALTPYWNLEMAEGETVLVDCGVYTDGESGIDVHWIKPDGTIINNTDDR